MEQYRWKMKYLLTDVLFSGNSSSEDLYRFIGEVEGEEEEEVVVEEEVSATTETTSRKTTEMIKTGRGGSRGAAADNSASLPVSLVRATCLELQDDTVKHNQQQSQDCYCVNDLTRVKLSKKVKINTIGTEINLSKTQFLQTTAQLKEKFWVFFNLEHH